MSWNLAAENADLRQQLELLQKENAKLKRKIKGDERRDVAAGRKRRFSNSDEELDWLRGQPA